VVTADPAGARAAPAGTLPLRRRRYRRLDSYAFNRKQKYFNKAHAASSI
jgi:hypothetical protein